MKSIFTSFLLLLFLNSFSQIPNFSFENWTSMGTYENPDNWSTLNNTTALANVFTATKATPGNPGSYYLKLTSKVVGPVTVGAIAVCGKFDSLTGNPISGFAYSGRPLNITGKWQHMIFTVPETPAIQGSMKVYLTHWNSGTQQREIVATVDTTFKGMVMSWQNFTFKFNYQSWKMPDSCIIVLKASGSVPKNQDYVWVDNLTFSGTYVGTEEISTFKPLIRVYPNPASTTAYVDLKTEKTSEISFQIFDLSGKIVKEDKVNLLNSNYTHTFDISDFQKGIYFVKVKSDNWTEVKRLVIQ